MVEQYGSFHRVVPKTEVISTGKNTAYGISAKCTRDKETKTVLRPSKLAAQQ